jgi:hypothetical protein
VDRIAEIYRNGNSRNIGNNSKNDTSSEMLELKKRVGL